MWYKIWTKGLWWYFWNGRTDVEIKQKTWRHCLGSQFSGRNPPKDSDFTALKVKFVEKEDKDNWCHGEIRQFCVSAKANWRFHQNILVLLRLLLKIKRIVEEEERKKEKTDFSVTSKWNSSGEKRKKKKERKEKKKERKREEILASLIKLKLVGRRKNTT